MMHVALVHDWLTGMRGGEKCLEVLCDIYPDADIFTLVHIPGSVSNKIESLNIHTSFIQKFPFAKKRYRSYLPIFPAAIEKINIRAYDLVISTSHCVAKGVIPHADALHICYCHTPMRYVWDMYDAYFGKDRVKGIAKMLIPHIAKYLRAWDVNSSQRVNHFIANSYHVQKRIWRTYRREADVIYPPVETKNTKLSDMSGDYFLIVTAFAPYKRVDLAIEVFNQLGERLVVVGTGQDEKRLKRMAESHIEFVGWVDREHLSNYYSNCKALIFPGEEDFGIVPVEAQCYGKPVIAYGIGGALETVKGDYVSNDVQSKRQKHTGIFFYPQTVEALKQAVQAFHNTAFDPKFIRGHALQFDKSFYQKKMAQLINQKLSTRKH